MWPGAHLGFLVGLLFLRLVFGQGNPTLWTSFVPLAVRSPYLNTWMDTSNVPFDPNVVRAPSTWPVFYPNNRPIMGWAGLVRIDNALTWKWLGDPGLPSGLNRSVLTNIQVTPTRTIMNMTAGPIDLTVTFLSPIEPSDPAKQSLPFSYVSLVAASNDGQPHTVQVYSDISAEWLSGDRADSVNWNAVMTDTVIIHEISLVTPMAFSEKGQQAEDTTTYYASPMGEGVTYMADTDINCRTRFNQSGSLTNLVNTGPGIINNPFNVFAVAKDLGTVTTTTTTPAVWAVGMLRDPAIAYTLPDGTLQLRDPYWKSQFNTPQDAVSAFLQDSDDAFNRAVALDTSILQKAGNISSKYSDLVALSARQAMAGTELTISRNSSGNFDMSDVMMFMKNIGPSSTGRVNPVEVLYSSFPSFLYLNTTYGAWLLEPILRFSNSSRWTQPYAPSDIGLNYPNATGNNQPHNQEVEQTGNMLIMTLAYAKYSGDGSILSNYYSLFKQWADYLVNNTNPVPTNQLTADDISRANSTNLAIKGIIGIQAMSQISDALNISADMEHYANIASGYVNTWKSLSLSTDSSSPQHVLSNYGASSSGTGSSSSWSLAYNLFADKWLKTGLVPDSVYQSESSFLQSLMSTNPNGISIDSVSATSQLPTGNTAWTLFVAATVDNATARDSLITPIWGHISQNQSHSIFPTVYNLSATGDAVNNIASPGVGAMFAPLALTMNPASRISTLQQTSLPKHKSNAGAIVGAVVAVIAVIVLLLLAFLYYRRRKSSDIESVSTEKMDPEPGQLDIRPIPYEYTPQEATLLPSPQETSTISPPEPVYMSSKAQEAAFPSAPVRRTGPASSASGYTTSSGPASSHEPPTEASSSRHSNTVSPISPQEVQGLRIEVENLRRVMQSFQTTERMDPPPLYEGEES